MHRTTTSEHIFDELTEMVEELLQKMGDVESPEIDKIRSKTRIALAAAKSAWADTKGYATRNLSRPGDYVRESVQESPWRMLGLAALLGIGTGALLMRSKSN
jgi:ElaB/YqjD/DUF883 family membrane-anchored ribosome-binding protein